MLDFPESYSTILALKKCLDRTNLVKIYANLVGRSCELSDQGGGEKIVDSGGHHAKHSQSIYQYAESSANHRSSRRYILANYSANKELPAKEERYTALHHFSFD